MSIRHPKMQEALAAAPTTAHAYEHDPYVRMALTMIDRLVREVDNECAQQGVSDHARTAIVARVVECAIPPQHVEAAQRARIESLRAAVTTPKSLTP